MRKSITNPDQLPLELPEPQISIYALRDPRTKQVRYVGKANVPTDRLSQHIASHKRGATRQWIDEILMDGLEPEIVIVETVPKSKWKEAECHWIAEFKRAGYELLNRSDGGESALGGKLLPRLFVDLQKVVIEYYRHPYGITDVGMGKALGLTRQRVYTIRKSLPVIELARGLYTMKPDDLMTRLAAATFWRNDFTYDFEGWMNSKREDVERRE